MTDWNDPAQHHIIEGWIAEGMANPPSKEVWGFFWATLRRAQADFDDLAIPHDAAANKEATKHVITVVIMALIDLAQNHPPMRIPALTGALIRLASAFSDLTNGNTPELFTPETKGPGRHKDTVSNAVAKGHAARAMSELMLAGDPKRKAAEKVALAYKAGKLPGHRSCSATKVANWRDKFKLGPDLPGLKKSIGLQRYEAPLSADAGTTPRQNADFLLRIMRAGGEI